MCGIVAYTGNKAAAPILLEGLTTLEYRGYDSSGLYVEGLGVIRAVGEVKKLKARLNGQHDNKGTAGIAHTRWATHGEPTEGNAHPHAAGNVVLVHNGIIENYAQLKEMLEKKGHHFVTETDTEVLAHLIDEKRKKTTSLQQAVMRALKEVVGTYGIAVMHKDEPTVLVIARMGSPIAIGVGKGEYLVASDAAPLLKHTKHVLYLNDGECALITPKTHEISTLDGRTLHREPQVINWDIEAVKKKGYPHFMLKEIMEAPEVLENSMRGRLDTKKGVAILKGLSRVEKKLATMKRLVIVGCGSAYYAGLVGKQLIEELAGVHVDVELASEFRYRAMLADRHTVVLAISQSGETADTLACVKEAKKQGMTTLGFVNAVGSTIAREVDAGVYNHAGPEIGVASTKAQLSQMTVLALFALYLGRNLGRNLGRKGELSEKEGKKFAKQLAALPTVARESLKQHDAIERLSKDYKEFRDFLYIGRSYNLASAFEGALKIKEVSYVHAEGYGAGEMKHGPIAMIDENFPTVAIAPKSATYEKMISNIEEIKARRGPVLAVATEGDREVKNLADACIEIPDIAESLSPIPVGIVLQLFAYHCGVAKGYNVDRPRNLAKSVTVE